MVGQRVFGELGLGMGLGLGFTGLGVRTSNFFTLLKHYSEIFRYISNSIFLP